MEKFTATNLKNLRSEFEELLAEFGQKHNINFDIGRISYSDETAKLKIDMAIANGKENPVQQKRWEDYINSNPWYNLENVEYGKSFNYQGKTYKIFDIAPRSKKRPIIVDCITDGKSYKFPTELLSFCLGITANVVGFEELIKTF